MSDLHKMSLKEYYELIGAGKKLTRRNVKTVLTHDTTPTPPPPPPKARPVQKSNSRPKQAPAPKKHRKIEVEDVIAPSDSEEQFKLKFLEGCVFGDVCRHRRIWVHEDTKWTLGRILSLESAATDQLYPRLYEVQISSEDGTKKREMIDIAEKECYLGGSIVDHNGEPAEVLWNFGRPQSYPTVDLLYENSKEHGSVDVQDLKQFDNPHPVMARYEEWIRTHKAMTVTMDQLEGQVCRWVKIQKTTNKTVRALLLRVLRDKMFVYTTKLNWIAIDLPKLTIDLTEPPVPISLLERFSFTRNLRKPYKSFWQKQGLEFTPANAQEETVNVSEQKCAKCYFILDELPWLRCEGCREYFHEQCMDGARKVAGARGGWRCPDCPRCDNCFSSQGTILHCMGCNHTSHEHCMDGTVTPLPVNKNWKCQTCAKCSACGETPADGQLKYNEDFIRCKPCEQKWRKKEYCGICLEFWQTKATKYTKDMIKCDQCAMWIHVLCDAELTKEKFHMLSLNENIKYLCPNCRKEEKNKKMAKFIKDLQKLEPNGYFIKPVEDETYKKVITTPICFDQMVQHAKDGKYTDNTDALIADLNLLCDNAMCYLKANTNGYQSANQLKTEGCTLILEKYPRPRSNSLTQSPTRKRPSETVEHPPILIEINKRDIEPYIYSRQRPSFYPAPISITYEDEILNNVDLCYICSSFISPDVVWLCATCSRAFHEFCIPPGQAGSREDWLCLDCRVCLSCHSEESAQNMVSCVECARSYHIQCLWPEVTALSLERWKCDNCFSCSRCHTRSYHQPGFSPKNEHFYPDNSVCYKCSWVKANNKYCPICDKDWCDPYGPPEVPNTQRNFCRFCNLYVHKDCIPDWKGACSKCFQANTSYTEAEASNVTKIHKLLGLISQINFYKEICTQCIEKQFNLQPEFAKELANLFLVDNAEFMSTSPEIINLFASRGVDIVKTECSRQPGYRLSTVPMHAGLRRSDLPMAKVPQVKMHKADPNFLWNIDWDTSTIIHNVSGDVGPLNDFDIIEQAASKSERGINGIFQTNDFIHGFDTFNHLVPFPEIEREIVIDAPSVAGGSGRQIGGIESPTRQSESNFDVLKNEFTNETLVDQYIQQELPAVIAITNRFAQWLKDNFMNLVVHELNRGQAPASNPIYVPRITPSRYEDRIEAAAPVVVEEDLTPQAVQVGTPAQQELVDSDDPIPSEIDCLTCCLCKQAGERRITGRLIPAEDNHWVHTNCALWSSEIVVNEVGFIVNQGAVYSKTKKQKCLHCRQGGASLICKVKRCPNSYHFPCALTAGVYFEDKRTTICPECTNELRRPPFPIEQMIRENNRQLVVTKGKKYAKKPVFTRGVCNRVGSLVLCTIPEAGLHENFVSVRRAWVNDMRLCVRCEKTGAVYKVSTADQSLCLESESIEDLREQLKRNYSFVMRTASDFFGYNIINHFLPPEPETTHYTPVKQQTRSLEEDLTALEPSSHPASILAPYVPKERTIQTIARKTGANTYDEFAGVTKKPENSLHKEYKKYKKNPLNDSLEILPSSIHGFGLFTTVDIPAGSIVTEYIGEVIRNKVADLREQEYEASGIGSCYMFRLNDDYVVDATMKGGKARFINHSCASNCEATICSLQDKTDHILLFALRPISKGEEITYDYKFEVEREKIACSCGSRECAGKLN